MCARYSLIMKDMVFVKATTQAHDEGKSFGKWINEKLEKWANEEGKDIVKQCIICAQKPSYNIKVNGVHNYLCKVHGGIFQNAGYTIGGIIE